MHNPPPPPVSSLAWLGLTTKLSCSTTQAVHIQKKETTPDCPATMLRGLSTTLLSRVCFPAALSPETARLSLYNSLCTSRQSAAHPAVHHSSQLTRGLFTTQQPCSPPAANTAGGSPVADTKTKHGILATALGDCTT
jgi:hypothetical protein